jgi:multidrug efflux system membrane fusion protein
VQSLRGTGAISAQEVESKQNAVTVAETQVASAEAALEKAKLDLDYCNITSPIDGRTGQRLVDVGNVVADSGPNGGTELLSIQRIRPIYVDFTIPEQELPRVRQHMSAGSLTVQVALPMESMLSRAGAGGPSSAPSSQPATGRLNEDGEAPREGSLTFLDNAVATGSGTIKLRATLANADNHFWPGQFVNVKLVLEVKKGAVLVPMAAQQIGQQGPYVYVVSEVPNSQDAAHPAHVAVLRPVDVGQRQGDLLVINRGLSAGENVVVEGQMSVVPGGPVNPLPPAPQQPNPAQQTASK